MVVQTDVNLAEILISSAPQQTATIKVGEKTFDLTYRALSWLDKTDCVARATEYVQAENGEIKTMFHIDIYFETALLRMVVDSPWPLSRQVLRNLTPEVGEQLQALIPTPLGEQENLDEGSRTPSKKARRKTRSSTEPQSN